MMAPVLDGEKGKNGERKHCRIFVGRATFQIQTGQMHSGDRLVILKGIKCLVGQQTIKRKEIEKRKTPVTKRCRRHVDSVFQYSFIWENKVLMVKGIAMGEITKEERLDRKGVLIERY